MSQVLMTEVKRGCGYRKHQGMYLVSDSGVSIHCELMPYLLHECNYCGLEVNQNRDIQWVKVPYFQGTCKNTSCFAWGHCAFTSKDTKPCPDCEKGWVVTEEEEETKRDVCSTCKGRGEIPNKVAVMWVGTKYYPTPADFMDEVDKLGISKRLPVHKIPKDLVLGETWVMLAHPKAVECSTCQGEGSYDKGDLDIPDTCFDCDGKGTKPGLFYAFQPSRLEVLLKDEDLVDTCPECRGTGQVGSKPGAISGVIPIQCDSCDGTGYIDSGWIEKIEKHHMTVIKVTDKQLQDEREIKKEEKLAKKGLERCENCKGSGLVTNTEDNLEDTCYVCKGEGVVPLSDPDQGELL